MEQVVKSVRVISSSIQALAQTPKIMDCIIGDTEELIKFVYHANPKRAVSVINTSIFQLGREKGYSKNETRLRELFSRGLYSMNPSAANAMNVLIVYVSGITFPGPQAKNQVRPPQARGASAHTNLPRD